MTPKIIHYCWFGRGAKPEAVSTYIQNWRTMLPEFTIVEWNEDNFDVSRIQYTAQAYAARKYAFVSDVARLHALYECGGIYLDTDVEVKKDLSPIMASGLTFGFEEFNYVATSTIISPPGALLICDFLATYSDRLFMNAEGLIDETTNVVKLTALLTDSGLKRDGSCQDLMYKGEPFRVLPQVFLSPMDYPNGIDNSNQQTYTIHHFGQSWVSGRYRLSSNLKRMLKKLVGGGGIKFLRRCASALHR